MTKEEQMIGDKTEAIKQLFFDLTAVEQMKVIEFVASIICVKMGDKKAALTTAAGFNKHIVQLINQYYKWNQVLCKELNL